MNQKYFCALAGTRSSEIRRRTDLIASASLFQSGVLISDVLSKGFDTSSHPNQKRPIVVARFRPVRSQIRGECSGTTQNPSERLSIEIVRLLRSTNEAWN